MTLIQINNILTQIAFSEPNIHSVLPAFTDLNREDAKYSSVILQQQQHTRTDDFISYNYYIGYVDRLVEDESNEVEVQSTAIEVINDIINAMKNTYPYDIIATNYNVFTQRFLAIAAGAYASVSIYVPVSECNDNDNFLASITKVITENGEYNINTPPDSIGIKNVKVVVNVQGGTSVLQEKSIDITENGVTAVTPDTGYNGLSKVNVNVNIDTEAIEERAFELGYEDGWSEGVENQKGKLSSLTAFINGKTYTREDGWKSVKVMVPEPLVQDERSFTVTQNVETVLPEDMAASMKKVIVDATSYGDSRFDEGVENQKGKMTELNVGANGTYERADGYNKVVVNVETATLQDVSVAIPEGDDDIVVTPAEGYDGMSRVYVDASGVITYGYNRGIADGKELQKNKLIDLSITENGTYEREDGYKKVVVDVSSVTSEFEKLTSDKKIFYYDGDDGADYSAIIALLPSDWTAVALHSLIVDVTPDDATVNITIE